MDQQANGSLWVRAFHDRLRFAALSANIDADVAVIGGGISGLASALFLARRGRKVVLLEARAIACGETGRTTAHLTELLDAGYVSLERKFGPEGAALAARASKAAIDSIETMCAELAPQARFERVDGHKWADTESQVKQLEGELAAMKRAGVAAEWSSEPLPFPTLRALVLHNQAQVHPGELINGLLQELLGLGVTIHEDSRVTEVHDGDPCRVVTPGGTVRANEVLVLTNVPVANRLAIHTKIAAYRSYVVAGKAESFPSGLFEDCAEPYHYIRRQETHQGTFVLVGGGDHRTGKTPSSSPFGDLVDFAQSKIPDFLPRNFWSGQIIEPSDGLPFIGRNTAAEHVYVATGFSGTGITFGVLSAMLLTAAVERLDSPWSSLFAATRIKPLAQAERCVVENATFPSRLIADRADRGQSLDDLESGQGELVRTANGRMLAVSRRDDGTLRAHSAVCPHMGCYVHFNSAERTWDCPCHGSRFDLDGQVLNGPTTMPLAAADVSVEPARSGELLHEPKPRRKSGLKRAL